MLVVLHTARASRGPLGEVLVQHLPSEVIQKRNESKIGIACVTKIILKVVILLQLIWGVTNRTLGAAGFLKCYSIFARSFHANRDDTQLLMVGRHPFVLRLTLTMFKELEYLGSSVH